MRTNLLTPLLSFSIVTALGIAWTVSASSAAPQEYASYYNMRFGFSLEYPADLTVTESNQSGGQQTIDFLPRSGTGKQFELLAIPYSQVDIAAEEYAPHDAYGTADQGLWLRDVNIVADDSTVQMWFVHSGVMYEIVGMKGDEDWLVDILKTWQFD
jgi:hypothetical protein